MASCWSLCLAIERSANRSRGSHGTQGHNKGTSERSDTQPTGEAQARSLGSDVVDVCLFGYSIYKGSS